MWGYGPGYGMMGGWGGPFMMIFWLLIFIALAAGVVWLLRSVAHSGTGPIHAAARRSAGLDVLEERYARGELGRDEYLQKKRDMEN